LGGNDLTNRKRHSSRDFWLRTTLFEAPTVADAMEHWWREDG